MDWEKILSPKRLKTDHLYQEKLSGDLRNDFESDYGRIVFSPAIRRMHDKTQVFPLTTDDNIHTRLTHSLEVSSVAYSMGINLCNENSFCEKTGYNKLNLVRIIPTILKTIALCHDIGNPPFGHYGEYVIQNHFEKFFNDNNNEIEISEEDKLEFTKFDGNAQGFRILSSLQVLQDVYGLNLTAATLSSYLKYPTLAIELKDGDKFYLDKIGVFRSEEKKLKRIREITGLNRTRNPLAYLMEAADTICYLIMDIEDGFNKKYYGVDDILNYLSKNGDSEVLETVKKVEEKVFSNVNKDYRNYENTRMVQLRVYLIKELVIKACSTFLENLSKIVDGNYFNELIKAPKMNVKKDDSKNSVKKDVKKRDLVKLLSDFCFEKIFKVREIQSLELAGESIINGLLEEFVSNFINYRKKTDKVAKRSERLFCMISDSIKHAIFLETGKSNLYELDNYYKLRLIVDFISGMTDFHSLRVYQKIKGIKIV